MDDALTHCEQIVRAADRDRFLATLFAPAAERGALHSLYAFNVEVGRVRDAAREPLAGEIRLQWWSEVLRGEREGEANAHPVAAALLSTLARHRLSAAPLIALLDARTFDLYDDPMASVAELEAYAAKTSSAVIALAAQILGGSGDALERLAHHGGLAHAIAGLMRAFPLHAARRQLYVPLELLQRHAVRPEDIYAGTSTAALRAALGELRGVARSRLEALRQRIANLPPQAVPALLPVALVGSVLDRLERADPFRPPDMAPWLRQWLIWRAARQPVRIAG
jgi:phytoene synthase